MFALSSHDGTHGAQGRPGLLLYSIGVGVGIGIGVELAGFAFTLFLMQGR